MEQVCHEETVPPCQSQGQVGTGVTAVGHGPWWVWVNILTRTSYCKVTHGNGYGGAWPAPVSGVSLTAPQPGSLGIIRAT